MKFLISIFLIFFVIPYLVRAVLKFFFGTSSSAQSGSGRQQSKSNAYTQPKADKKKVFTKEEGEYVDYVEVKD